MNKTLLLSLLAAVLATSCLTACGAGETSASSNKQSPTETVAPTPEPTAKLTFNPWYVDIQDVKNYRNVSNWVLKDNTYSSKVRMDVMGYANTVGIDINLLNFGDPVTIKDTTAILDCIHRWGFKKPEMKFTFPSITSKLPTTGNSSSYNNAEIEKDANWVNLRDNYCETSYDGYVVGGFYNPEQVANGDKYLTMAQMIDIMHRILKSEDKIPNTAYYYTKESFVTEANYDEAYLNYIVDCAEELGVANLLPYEPGISTLNLDVVISANDFLHLILETYNYCGLDRPVVR